MVKQRGSETAENDGSKLVNLAHPRCQPSLPARGCYPACSQPRLSQTSVFKETKKNVCGLVPQRQGRGTLTPHLLTTHEGSHELRHVTMFRFHFHHSCYGILLHCPVTPDTCPMIIHPLSLFALLCILLEGYCGLVFSPRNNPPGGYRGELSVHLVHCFCSKFTLLSSPPLRVGERKRGE
jgi:hypothetical protein